MLNRNKIIIACLPSLQPSLAVCGLLGKWLWCPSSIPGQIISNLKIRLPAIIACGGFLRGCQVWMLMLGFVGWLLLYSAWRIFPSTVNPPRDSRKEPQPRVLPWELVPGSAGNSGQTLRKRKAPRLCAPIPNNSLSCSLPHLLPVLEKRILVPNVCLWQALEQRVCLQRLAQKVTATIIQITRGHLASLVRDQNPEQSPVDWAGRCPNSLGICAQIPLNLISWF